MLSPIPYRLPKVYIPKIKGSTKPDLLQNWYVEFYYKNPKGEMKRFRHYEGINGHTTIQARTQAANDLKIAIYELLVNQNYNPFQKDYEAEKNKKLARVCDMDKTAYSSKERFLASLLEHKASPRPTTLPSLLTRLHDE